MNIYKFKNYLRVTYLDGRLMNIELTNHCDLIVYEGIRNEVKYFEDELSKEFILQARVNASDKIAIFCMAYKAYTLKTVGVEQDYKVSKQESGMIKNFNFTVEYLRVFFTNDFWTKDKTISNYVKHYNAIQRLAAERAKTAGTGSAGSESMAEALHKWF